MKTWIMQHMLEKLLLSRLQAEVWDPLTDPSTLVYTPGYHHWVTGRTASSPPSGTSCPQPCPPGRSAKLILLPWQEVFSRGSMCAFLTKNIVPKLEQALTTLPITCGEL